MIFRNLPRPILMHPKRSSNVASYDSLDDQRRVRHAASAMDFIGRAILQAGGVHSDAELHLLDVEAKTAELNREVSNGN
jgi:hypothetical protein